jgi:hypothetical protein
MRTSRAASSCSATRLAARRSRPRPQPLAGLLHCWTISARVGRIAISRRHPVVRNDAVGDSRGIGDRAERNGRPHGGGRGCLFGATAATWVAEFTVGGRGLYFSRARMACFGCCRRVRVGVYARTAAPGRSRRQTAACTSRVGRQSRAADGLGRARPAPRLGQPVRPGGADTRRHVVGAFSFGTQDQVDPGQARHRRGQLLRVLDETRKP